MDIPFSHFFIYDVAKSDINRAKHGIDFEAAQALWSDEKHVTAPARSHRELRWIVIGEIDGRMWAAIVTHRHSAIRIISVRRARKKEEEAYGRGRT